MVYVMGTVAGECHIDHAVDQVDRIIAQVNRLVRQALELPEYAHNTLGIDHGGTACLVSIRKAVEKAVLQHFFPHELLIANGVAGKPAGKLAR